MTLDEAKELHAALDYLFRKPSPLPIVIPAQKEYYPVPAPHQPTWPGTPTLPSYPTIICQSGL